MAKDKAAEEGKRKVVRMAQVGAEVTATAVTFGEMAVAAHTTVALRMMRLAGTLADPKKLNDPEFRRMGQEKMVAASQAAFAVAEGWRVVQDGLWDWTTIQAAAWERMVMEVTLAPHPGVAATALSRFTDRSMDAAETAATHFAVATSRLGGLGLAPIHRATRANARRLSREAKLPALLG